MGLAVWAAPEEQLENPLPVLPEAVAQELSAQVLEAAEVAPGPRVEVKEQEGSSQSRSLEAEEVLVEGFVPVAAAAVFVVYT